MISSSTTSLAWIPKCKPDPETIQSGKRIKTINVQPWVPVEMAPASPCSEIEPKLLIASPCRNSSSFKAVKRIPASTFTVFACLSTVKMRFKFLRQIMCPSVTAMLLGEWLSPTTFTLSPFPFALWKRVSESTKEVDGYSQLQNLKNFLFVGWFIVELWSASKDLGPILPTVVCLSSQRRTFLQLA